MQATETLVGSTFPSMKVPPKRKGNKILRKTLSPQLVTLNESPSEKEGKSQPGCYFPCHALALNESPSEKEGK